MLFQVLRILIFMANHFSHGFKVFIVGCKSGPLEHLCTIRDSTPVLSVLLDCDTPTWTLSRKGLPCYSSLGQRCPYTAGAPLWPCSMQEFQFPLPRLQRPGILAIRASTGVQGPPWPQWSHFSGLLL